jgi:hypothetical protein
MLLDLAGPDGDSCNVEAGILCYMDGIQLSSVESPSDSLKRTGQGSTARILQRSPKASSGAGTVERHKVPSRLTNHRIEDRRRDILHNRPVIADGLLEWSQPIRQDATFAQKNGMQLHACALWGIAGAWGLMELAA